MITIRARNVNDAYRQGLNLMQQYGEESPSRNGPVLRINDIVATHYERPHERVLFDPHRNANPFFHLFEALWMLSGANDVRALSHILPNFKQYSDDGLTFHGAYGSRWRYWPVEIGHGAKHIDQLALAIEMLKKDPTSRRAVIGMWDPRRDLNANSKDIPCNDLINLGIRNGRLDLSVMCRSNDIIWGCYGANAVHMSMLHEYLAQMIGVEMGAYTQISFDYHAYVESPYRFESFIKDDGGEQWINPYDVIINDALDRRFTVVPLVTHPESFDAELLDFVHALRKDGTVLGLNWEAFRNRFFRRIALPMHQAFEFYKIDKIPTAIMTLDNAQTDFGHQGNDWLLAGRQWLQRIQWKREYTGQAEAR